MGANDGSRLRPTPSSSTPKTATILHVDMDSFYASVEVLEDAGLAGRPLIVGGSGERGVVASCTYEARAFGVRSGMPSVQARRLCPGAVFVPGRHDLYAAYSRRLHEVFGAVTPLVEGISLDEAFLDVAGAGRRLGSPDDIAHTVRRRVAAEVGLPCSVGVASSKLLAKLASRAAKPRPSPSGPEPGPGVVTVRPGTELQFLHPLPMSALWGLGPAGRRRLSRYGVRTVGDVAALPVATLAAALGPTLGPAIHDLAWGRDDRAVEPNRAPKSVGHEETYARDLHRHDELHREVVRLSDAVASRLRAEGVAGRTLTVKVRFHDFRTITRSRTVAAPIDAGPALAAVAAALVAEVDPSPGVRLLGVSASNLVAAGAQLCLGDDRGERWHRASRAVDEVRRRFGPTAVAPATLAGEGGVRVRRRGDGQWGPERDRAP